MTRTLLILLAILLFLPNLFDTSFFHEEKYNNREEFNPSLSYINSLDKLDQHIDSIAIALKLNKDSARYRYVYEISKIIRERFYHGYSHFTFSENWIASLAGRFIEEGLGSKVHVDKILSQDNAACSQQAIVMMAVLRRKGIPNRHLGFPHHYTLEAFIDNKWYFFDPNMEPTMNQAQRCEDSWKYHSDSLKKYYDASKTKAINFDFGYGLSPDKGTINEEPALNARIFQTSTAILSKTLWCFPLLLIFMRNKAYFPFNKKAV